MKEDFLHYPAVPFKVDLSSFLAQHDLIYLSPAKTWEDGTFLGNGDLCANFHKPKAFEWGISKADVWDRRFDRASAPLTPHVEVMRLVMEEDRLGLFDLTDREAPPYSKFPYSTMPQAWMHPPSPKPCGDLRLFVGGYNPDFTTEIHDHFEQRLSLYNATATTTYSTRYGSGKITSFVSATRDLLVVQVEDTATLPGRRAIELVRPADPTLGLPEYGQKDDFAWIDYAFPDGFRYVIMARVLGSIQELEPLADGFRWQPAYGNPFQGTIYVSVATNREHDDPLETARAIIENAILDRPEVVHQEHQDWWHDFWASSFLDLSDDYLENLWYFSIYLLACSSRGTQPPPLLGPWYLDDFQPWHGDYHGNVNIQQLYWPVLSANHPQLAQPYIHTFHAMLPMVEEETQRVFGMRGAKYPSMTIDTGIEMGFGWARYWMHVPAWHTRIFWQYYRYTQDRDFLATVAYPVMKSVLTFYEDYVSRDEQGAIHIWPSNSSEQGVWWVRDVTLDLTLLRELLTAAIEAANILSVDDDQKAIWGELLKNLAPYPAADGFILDYEGAPADLPLNHPALIGPIFPVGDVQEGHPQWELFKRTAYGLLARSGRQVDLAPFDLPTWNDDMSWPWLCCLMARLGDAETARAYLYDLAVWQFMKFNGTFSWTAAWTHKQRIRQPAMLNSSGGFAAAINEMVLQSYDGVIRVFPAMPADWSGRFAHFRAAGAFLVSASCREGVVDWIVIHSEAGGLCQIANPWPGQEVEVRQLPTEGILLSTTASILTFETRSTITYRLLPKGKLLSVEEETITGQRRQEPRVYWGPRYLAHGEYPVYLGKPQALKKW